ncbi:MAG: diguanylate cyclase [Gammaproteobacteria bacterium]|nr:MAG: diguanylate cyclase [Gammaproteobacteria bacterium]
MPTHLWRILATLAGICLVAGYAWITGENLRKDRLVALDQSLNQAAQAVSTSVSRINDHLRTLQRVAQDAPFHKHDARFEQEAELFVARPWGGYALDPEKARTLPWGRTVQATTREDPRRMAPPVQAELHMALWLAPLFLTARQNLAESAWVYYVSRHRFITIAPWVDDSQYHYSDATLTQEFFTRATPVRNPDRQPFWTRAYVDEYGQGLMVTASAPVYYQGDFTGIVAIDITLDTLSRLLSNQLLGPSETLLLVNREHQIIATPGYVGRTSDSVRMFSSLVDDTGLVPLGNPDTIPLTGFLEQKGQLYARRPIQGAPWDLILQVDGQTLQSQVLSELTPKVALLLMAMAILVVVSYLLRTQRALMSAEKRHSLLFSQSAAPQLIINPESGVILESNPAAKALLGEETLSREVLRLQESKPADGKGRQPLQTSFTLTGAHGETRYIDAFATPMEVDGQPVLYTILQDVTRRKQAEEKAQYRAFHDMLTHLPNRAFLMESLATHLAQHERRQDMLAVLFIDLDHFKHINDTLGHEVGDVVLREAAERLKRHLREGDIIARLGGDEFTVILPNLPNETTAANVATKLIAHILPAFEVQGYELHIGASIGIALFPRDGTTPSDLIKHADVAMYRAKENGRNQYCFYETAMSEAVSERIRLENDLRHAIAFDQLFVEYLPVMELETLRVSGVEALVRWNHPVHGEMPPASFLALADDSGLTDDLTDLMIRYALEDARSWRSESGAVLPTLYLNVARRQVLSTGPLGLIHEARNGGTDLELPVTLEIPETVLHQHPHEVQQFCSRARALNLPVCVDDFGTGSTSLRFLKRFDLAELKIDPEFLEAAQQNETERHLLGATVEAARAMGLRTVAKGVESTAQLKLVRALGFDRAQGYAISGPLPASAIRSIMVTGLPFNANLLSS